MQKKEIEGERERERELKNERTAILPPLTAKTTASALMTLDPQVISESALRSNPRGLPGLYSNTLAAVNSVCQPLLALTTGKR